MKKSIVISFVNGVMFKDVKKCHCIFQPREISEGTLMSDRIEWHYIQLGRVNGVQDPATLDPVEKLAAYLKYAHEEKMEDYLKKLIASTEVISVTEAVFEKLTEEEIAYELRESQERYEYDIASIKSLMAKEITAQVTAEVTDRTEERLSCLFHKLLTQHRYDDLEKATHDKDYRQDLYEELGL